MKLSVTALLLSVGVALAVPVESGEAPVLSQRELVNCTVPAVPSPPNCYCSGQTVYCPAFDVTGPNGELVERSLCTYKPVGPCSH